MIAGKNLLKREQGMSFYILEYKNTIARKRHLCNYCLEAIEKGEEYDYQKRIYEYDGKIYEWRTHLACSRVASAIWDYCDPDDVLSDQNFRDGCHKICHRFVCPNCQKWNKEYLGCDEGEIYCIDKMDSFFKTHELYRVGRKAWYEFWSCREKTEGNE